MCLHISLTPALFPCNNKLKKPKPNKPQNRLARKRRALVPCRGLSGVDGFIILAGSITQYPLASVAETYSPLRDCSERQTQVMPFQPGHPTGSSKEPESPCEQWEDKFLKARRQFPAAFCFLPSLDKHISGGSRQEPRNAACTGNRPLIPIFPLLKQITAEGALRKGKKGFRDWEG